MKLFEIFTKQICRHQFEVKELTMKDIFVNSDFKNCSEIEIIKKCEHCNKIEKESKIFTINNSFSENVELFEELTKKNFLNSDTYRLKNIKNNTLLNLLEELKDNYYFTFKNLDDEIIITIIKKELI